MLAEQALTRFQLEHLRCVYSSHVIVSTSCNVAILLADAWDAAGTDMPWHAHLGCVNLVHHSRRIDPKKQTGVAKKLIHPYTEQ